MTSTTVANELTKWLAESIDSVEGLPTSLGAASFQSSYLRVLRAGLDQAQEVSDRFTTLIERWQSSDLQSARFLDEYIDAMSVAVDDEEVFLPSFSDSCLKDLRDRSPFRGLLYCWLLGEASYALRRGKTEEALTALHTLKTKLSVYGARSEGSLPPTDQLDRDIIQVKAMVTEVIMARKYGWTRNFYYPCRTSTHFYLSGIRFYWNPLVEGDWLDPTASRSTSAENDRFCVQSTTSGLFSASERYGYLISSHASMKVKSEEAHALLEQIPVGSLTLDLTNDRPQRADRVAAVYFERWSSRVARKTLPIVNDAVLSCERVLDTPARKRRRMRKEVADEFENMSGKNPMRTFYFDSGLLAVARRAYHHPEQSPMVQYLTTTRSNPAVDDSDAGPEMLSAVRKYCGTGLKVYVEPRFTFSRSELSQWTLVPLGPGLRDARTIWSNRSEASAHIVHGFEGRSSGYLINRSKRALRLAPALDSAADVGLKSSLGIATGGTFTPDWLLITTLAALLGATTAAGETALGMHRVHKELRGVPTSNRYKEVQSLKDWAHIL